MSSAMQMTYDRRMLMTRKNRSPDQEMQNQDLAMYSYIDPLTGLNNRASGEQQIINVLEGDDPAGALLMIDIDHFKSVNDTYGHAMGDRILKRFAEILKSFIRNEDILMRLGGDEFIIFYRNFTEPDQLAERCRRIIEKVEYLIGDMVDERIGQTISASIGIAISGINGNDLKTLKDHADKALYYVKQHSKHGFLLYEDGVDSVHEVSKHRGSVDISVLKTMINENGLDRGAYLVDYDSFKNLYRFLSINLKRIDTSYQLVLFTLTLKKPATSLSIINLERQLGRLIGKTLRVGDVAAQYGRNQYVVLLSGTNTDNGKIAANRVLNNWLEEFESSCNISYEIEDLCDDKSEIAL
jgi:diguanylate cyclase (GGDEF)-like protein